MKIMPTVTPLVIWHATVGVKGIRGHNSKLQHQVHPGSHNGSLFADQIFMPECILRAVYSNRYFPLRYIIFPRPLIDITVGSQR